MAATTTPSPTNCSTCIGVTGIQLSAFLGVSAQCQLCGFVTSTTLNGPSGVIAAGNATVIGACTVCCNGSLQTFPNPCLAYYIDTVGQAANLNNLAPLCYAYRGLISILSSTYPNPAAVLLNTKCRNECTDGLNNCAKNGSSTCTDLTAGWNCTCNSGYQGNGTTCNDIDECANSTTCGTNALCTNSIGGYNCTCNQNYVGDGHTCTFNCTTCVGYTPGAFVTANPQCQLCGLVTSTTLNGPFGVIAGGNATVIGACTACCNAALAVFPNPCLAFFTDSVGQAANLKGLAPLCYAYRGLISSLSTTYPNPATVQLDIQCRDECTDGVNTCSKNGSTCTDIRTGQGFTCQCNQGYTDNSVGQPGTNCTDINECLNTTICDPNADCINFGGGYNCTCHANYTGDGKTCFLGCSQCGSYTPLGLITEQTDCTLCGTETLQYGPGIISNATVRTACIACCNTTLPLFPNPCLSYFADAVKQASNVANIAVVCNIYRPNIPVLNASYPTPVVLDVQCRDECTDGIALCTPNASQCTNTPYSYTCACNQGYIDSNGDGKNCTDIDECLNSTICGANAHCTNFGGGYNCTCNSGFKGDGIVCTQDCNACVNFVPQAMIDSWALCLHVSSLTKAQILANITEELNYANCCSTIKSNAQDPCIGYWLDHTASYPDAAPNASYWSKMCSLSPTPFTLNNICLDECTDGVAPCAVGTSTCQDLSNGFTCTCNHGYQGNGTQCDDIDECTGTPFPCDSNANCNNTIGSFTCQCKSSYLGDGFVCSKDCVGVCGNYVPPPFQTNCSACIATYNLDHNLSGITGASLDNCQACCTELSSIASGGNNVCLLYWAQNTTAWWLNIPILVSDICGALPIDPPIAIQSLDIECFDECLHPVCDPIATCTDIPTGFTCTCPSGYSLNGTTCVDINECALAGYCSVYGTCTNTNGSYICVCDEPYFGNGSFCEFDCYRECEHWLPTNTSGLDSTYYPTLSACNAYNEKGQQSDFVTCCNLAHYGPNPCIGYWLAKDPFGKKFGNNYPLLLTVCPGGPYARNHTCDQNIDFCFFGLDNCDANATCTTNTSASSGYSCMCNAGYTGDGVKCTSVNATDPCLANACPNGATCTPNATATHGRNCNCSNGYWFDETKNQCYDPCNCTGFSLTAVIDFTVCATCYPVATNCTACCSVVNAGAQQPCAYYAIAQANSDSTLAPILGAVKASCLAIGVTFNTSTYCTGTCHDGVKKGLETDVDCGGPSCPACSREGLTCAKPQDCASGLSCTQSGTNKTCTAASTGGGGGSKKAGLKEYAVLVAVIGVIIFVAGVLTTWWWWRQVLIADQGYRYAQSNSVPTGTEGGHGTGVEVTDLTGVPPPGDAESPRRGGDDEVYVS